MTARSTPDHVEAGIEVEVPPGVAFTVFTEGMALWWPREFTWSEDLLEGMGMEPRPGGLCFERGPHGFRIDWGRVVVWEPPRTVSFLWQITPERAPQPDPERASRVDVRFHVADREATAVGVRHSDFGRHGPEGDRYRDAMAEVGWPQILHGYATAVGPVG